MNLYNLTDLANNEMREFGLYTIANRAIPNMYDGLKPVQRFYLYSSIENTPKDYKKVSAVAGVISDYGYQHGEASAASAGQLMAATWNNNIVLIEGRGSFGTRQVQEAGASRYVYTRLHENFNKYIKDIDLAPEHYDPEHLPPQFYIPVIPLVLSNGTKGIATGFATNILPRSEKDLIKACKEYLNNGTIKKRLPIIFPEFRGQTYYDAVTDKFYCRGAFERPSATALIINEIPYGYDRESYVTILDKLEEDDVILGYEDQCSTNGFKFTVKLKNAAAKKFNTDDKILKAFKLEKVLSENITVIDENFKLREYTDERDLIRDFCDYRVSVLEERIAKRIEEYTEKMRWLTVRKEFIMAVLNDKIVFKNKTKVQVGDQILKVTPAIEPDINRLLSMNILSLTKEMVTDLNERIKEANVELKFWQTTTSYDQFMTDLEFK
jgi:DNA gyrase/topoisomerase IV subunit A